MKPHQKSVQTFKSVNSLIVSSLQPSRPNDGRKTLGNVLSVVSDTGIICSSSKSMMTSQFRAHQLIYSANLQFLVKSLRDQVRPAMSGVSYSGNDGVPGLCHVWYSSSSSSRHERQSQEKPHQYVSSVSHSSDSATVAAAVAAVMRSYQLFGGG